MPRRLVAAFLVSSSLQATWAREDLFCFRTAICLGGLGRKMYIGEQGTDQCNTKCVWLPFLYPDYECGECDEVPGVKQYSIDIDVPPPAETDIEYFYNATHFWENIVTGGLNDKWVLQEDLQVALSPLRGCGWRWAVDDLFICMTYADYSYEIAAISAPYIFRANDEQLPAVGLSQINANYVSKWKSERILQDIIQREIGYIMGIGSMWERKGLVKNCKYLGENANLQYQTLSGGTCDSVPLDQHSCKYFDDTCLGDELFAATPDGELVVSPIAVAALEDLGYVVNYDKAGAITVPTGCCGNRRRRQLTAENHRRAMEVGREILAEQAAQPDLPEGLEYAGFVKVTMVQDGEFYDIVVKSEDVLA